MTRLEAYRAAFVVLAACLAGIATAADDAKLDLASPRERLEAYVRANGDTSAAPVATCHQYTGPRAHRPCVEVFQLPKKEKT